MLPGLLISQHRDQDFTPDDLDIQPGSLRNVLSQYDAQWPFPDKDKRDIVKSYLISQAIEELHSTPNFEDEDTLNDTLIISAEVISRTNSLRLARDYKLMFDTAEVFRQKRAR